MRALQHIGFALLLALSVGGLTAPAHAEPKPGAEKPKNNKQHDAKDAAYIVVQATFANTTVTINDEPYPENSKVGAVVVANKTYEVVVTDKKSSSTKRYAVTLERGEARVIIVDLSGGTAGGGAAAYPTTVTANQPVPETGEAEEGSSQGFLTVNASPTAQVYIDGKLVASKTPLVKHSVGMGNHTVRVYYVDLKKFSETKRAMISEGRHVNLYFQNAE